MTATLKALDKEKPTAAGPEANAKPVCSEGHELRNFILQTDGFCCEECGNDLEEGGQCLRCDECGGSTFCYGCMGATPPQQPKKTSAPSRPQVNMYKPSHHKAANSDTIHISSSQLTKPRLSLLSESDDEAPATKEEEAAGTLTQVDAEAMPAMGLP